MDTQKVFQKGIFAIIDLNTSDLSIRNIFSKFWDKHSR